MVKWATSRLEYVVFDTNHQDNADSEAGDHVFIKYRRKIYYCYYEGCRRTMTNISDGSFGSYPAPVTEMDPRSQYCSWLITIPTKCVISLNFSEMNIPSCDDTFLRIYDGANEKAPLLGTFCGSNASKQVQISSSTNSLYVVANSGRIGGRLRPVFAFQGHYSGSFKDSGFRCTTAPSGRVPFFSQNCSWLITIPATSVVTLSFSELTIPNCDDTFLRIYDGAKEKAPLLGSYCGSNASTQIEITSSTNSLYVVANTGMHGKNKKDDTFLRIYDGANKEAPLFGTYCESRSNASTEVVNITSAGNAVYVVANFGRNGKNENQVFSFRAHFSGSFKDSVNEDRSLSKLVIILSIVGLGLLLILVIIVVLVKYKRRNAETKSIVAPVNIPLEKVENSEVDQEPVCSDDEISTEYYENAPVHIRNAEPKSVALVNIPLEKVENLEVDQEPVRSDDEISTEYYENAPVHIRNAEPKSVALVNIPLEKVENLEVDQEPVRSDDEISTEYYENEPVHSDQVEDDAYEKCFIPGYTEVHGHEYKLYNSNMCKVTKASFQRISHILPWIFGIALSFSHGQDVDWPSGSYGLPKPKSGCPISKTSVWSEGWRFQDMENKASTQFFRSRLSSDSHFDIKIIGEKRDINRTFCMKQNSGRVQNVFWPSGKYCIYKKDGACPKNMASGWVKWDDENYKNRNKKRGSLPQGVYNKDTKIHYCCQTNGKWYDSIELPVNRPFYLLTSNSVDTPKCQMVKWATSRLEYVVFDTEHSSKTNSQAGNHVFRKNRRIYYCYYEGCRRTMTNISRGSFGSYPAPVTEMDPRSKYCSWLITTPATSVISLSFSEMTIPSCDDTFLRIYDGANEKARLLGSYCGSNASTQVQITSSTNRLHVVANSGSIRNRRVFTFRARYSESSKSSEVRRIEANQGISKLVMILAIVGLALVLIIIIIVVLVKYKRRNAEPQLVAPVNIPLEKAENSEVDQRPARSHVETPNYETTSEKSDDSYDTVNFLAKSPFDEKAKKKTESNDDVYTALDLKERETENDYEKLFK
ncbi:uncharacterized protein LOC114522985 isoform X2 [Dendronephthya gigantea]|uniref:uncharacterized protein LOC114522985 isoform X2 n=1 Tax=Dendronephthya gigantea TaxID=151771 RepID=UPI0010695D8E|nr:uncharacterized protein LOC114522985 isoform X2 [Dendronephthya gigantea]